MNRIMSTGTSVIARTEEKPTASVFVQASGRNIRPSCASSKNTGRNETTMITSEKKMAGPTCLRRIQENLSVSATSGSRSLASEDLPLGKLPVSVFDHDDGRVHENANRQRQPAQRHDVRADMQVIHRDERCEHRDGQSQDRNQRRTEVE